MNNPIKKLNCWIDTIWITFKSFLQTGNTNPIMGHIYTKHEIHRNCCVIVQYCGDCDNMSIVWQKEGLNTDNEMMEIYGVKEGAVDFTNN